jgi:hypothetical protein
MSFKLKNLLRILLYLPNYMPFNQTYCFSYYLMKFYCSFFFNFFLKILKNFRQKWNQSFFKYFRSNPKLFYLLFHLTQTHVIIYLRKLNQKHRHSFIIGNISCHHNFEFLCCLFLGVNFRKLLKNF